MSKVISFRLNPDNPREAEALTVVQKRLTQGFSTRHTITEALLELDSSNSQAAENNMLRDLSHQLKKILENIESGTSFMKTKGEVSTKEKLSEGFVNSILNSAKPGFYTEA